jgi:hypothetical protein
VSDIYGDVAELIRQMNDQFRVPESLLGDPFGFAGMKVLIHSDPPPQPKLAISEDFPYCTDEGRERFNKRMVELFGYREPVSLWYDKNTLYRFGDTLVMQPEHAVLLRGLTS